MADFTSGCRDIKKLNALCQTLLNLALNEIKKNGINPLVVETYRSQERQNYLFCKGRTVDECVVKGIKKVFAITHCTLSQGKITWTLKSEHKNKNATDIVPVRNGKAVWNSKDVETKKIIAIMEKYGFEAGANWKSSPDSPHFQIKGVSMFATTYSAKNNNIFITKMIQKALNEKLGIHLFVDGKWGSLTTAAVNDFRKKMKYKIINGQLGSEALKALLR
jgi:peptidoglycan L-alanyl-D-glutamate endopeptidase CwlK